VKRAVICGMVAAMAIPTTAAAAVRHFHGAGQDGGTVSFEAKVRHGRTGKVAVGFAWKNLPVHCATGSTDTDGSFTRRMRVSGRRFHGSGRVRTGAGWVIARVTGKFGRHMKGAHGKIRVHGDFGARATDCDTGRDRWRAHRVAA
jgi:hypothetical protein